MLESKYKTSNKVIGILNRIIFKNEDNGYHVLSVDITDELTDTTVTINHPNLFQGVTYEFTGEWVKTQQYGYQFKANNALEVQPSTKAGLLAYLQSDFFNGIGPVIAKRIVDHFGDDVIETLNKDPDQLLKISGISKAKLVKIKNAWEENKEINEVMMFLQQYGISTLYATKIFEHYGKNCVAQILNNPYKLAIDISGIGFIFADKIALQIGFEPNSPERVRACINFILEQSTMEGHCYLHHKQIMSRVSSLLQVDVKDQIQSLLDIMEKRHEIKSCTFNGEEKRYYGKTLFYNEVYCAEKVHTLNEKSQKIKIDNSLLDKGDIKLSDEQKTAVKNIIGKGISVLTGGPGVGKCLKKGTLVLMYNGEKKKVEDIRVGDLLMGDDSTPRKVLSLARGEEKMYDVISNDGKEWGCNESHILSLIYNDSSRNNIINGKKLKKGDIIDISINDYLKLSNRKKHHLKQYSTEINYSPKKLDIPPYLLGLWLGDGGHKENKIFNKDQEVFEYGESIASKINLIYKKTTPKNRCDFISFNGVKNHSFTTLLRKYNLFGNKHIPEDYLINSKKNRLELIAGLIDSDGYLTKSGVFEITLTNKNLSYQIQDIVLSCGIKCSLSTKLATMKRKNGTLYKTNAYRLIFSDHLNQIPTKIKRKNSNNNPNKNPLHSGFKLIDKGIGEYYGFEIDGNHRFVLGNYVVTHNTQTTKKIVEVLQFLGKNIVLAAPTGRASKRMTEVIGMEASTIHRLLSWDPHNGGFQKGEHNPIEADFIIIDESSMLDINLASALLRATNADSQILFIGDIDQLLPVGPGNFFKDVIKSQLIPTYRLTKIFRQGQESFIVKHAHEINSGIIPSISNPLLNPSLWKDGHDCFFIESGFSEYGSDRHRYPKTSSLHYNLDIVQMIVKLYMDIIPKYKGDDADIQILIPMNVGDLGCVKINSIIQEKVNPHKKGHGEIKIKDRFFRVGDKVIQTKNNYDLGVFNGDIGRIISINEKEMTLTIRFPDEQESIYRKSDIFELDLAYAISIHKSQGSEFGCVILPIMNQYYRMLERCLIYTALTRAKKCAIFVGQTNALETAIKNVDSSERQTSLRDMLLDESFASPLL